MLAVQWEAGDVAIIHIYNRGSFLMLYCMIQPQNQFE